MQAVYSLLSVECIKVFKAEEPARSNRSRVVSDIPYTCETK